MPIASRNSIRKASGIPEAFLGKAESRAAHAERHCRASLGAARYQALLDAGAADDGYAQLLEAESLLCLYYALPFLNLSLTETGGIVKATGVEESRTEMMSKGELDKYAGSIYDQAESILAGLTETDQAQATLPISFI